MKRVMVTGGTGFVGRWCLEKLANLEVHALARSPHPISGSTVHWHAVDLFDASAVAAVLAEVRPSHLLHLAWSANPPDYWTAPDNLRWVAASLNLIQAFAENGGRRAVVAGTSAEYDWSTGICHESSTPLRPATLYGVCKNSLRVIAETFAKQAGLSLAWGRLFFLYGPGEHPRRLVASVIRSLLAGNAAHCSAGTQQRDFLYVEDVADALVSLLLSDLEGGINIASGNALAVRDLILQIAGQLGRTDLVQLGALPMPAGEPDVLVADVHRLDQELHWQPKFDLTAGIERSIQWWRGQEGN